MLTREEAIDLGSFINECADKLVSTAGMNIVYDEKCFSHSIHCRLRDLTEKIAIGEPIPDEIFKSVENYFKLNKKKINKIYLLEGTQWANTAALEIKLNQVIGVINQLIDLVEHIVPQKNIIDAISNIAGVLAFVADEAGLHCDGMLQEALNLLKEK
jgi:hypothetical protein